MPKPRFIDLLDLEGLGFSLDEASFEKEMQRLTSKEMSILQYIPRGGIKISIRIGAATREIAAKEQYVVLADNIHRQLVGYGAGLSRVLAGLIPTRRFSPEFVLELAIRSLAIHEVRHRLQHNRSIKIFEEGEGKSRDKLLNSVIQITEGVFLRYRRRLLKDGETNEAINHLTRSVEFDAHVIESLFVCVMCREGDISKEKATQLLLLEQPG